MKEYEYMCGLHDTPRSLDWCVDNCESYYSCDSVAWANDELRDRELRQIE